MLQQCNVIHYFLCLQTVVRRIICQSKYMVCALLRHKNGSATSHLLISRVPSIWRRSFELLHLMCKSQGRTLMKITNICERIRSVPGNSGRPVISSAIMQPTDHISTTETSHSLSQTTHSYYCYSCMIQVS